MTELISIIIPCHNEEGNLTPLIEQAHTICAKFPHEIIIVDDGSTDGSRQEIETIKNNYSNVSPVFLRKNYGQTAAIAAGIDYSKGETIILLDADGQNDPSDIPALLSKLNEGYDVVSGWRKDRQDPFLNRRLPSMIANFLISFSTGVYLHDYGCSLKAYKRSALKHLQLYGEMHRFIPAWCAWQGGKIAEVVVKHHPRTRGQSKYGIWRIFKVIIDLMTLKFFSGYFYKPNYLFSGVGLTTFFLSLLFAAVAFFDKYGPDHFPEYRVPALLLSATLGLVSLFLILMGLMAELLVRLYFQVGNQKPYRLLND